MLLGSRAGQLSAGMMSSTQPLDDSRLHCACSACVRHVRVGISLAFGLPFFNWCCVVLCTLRFWGVLMLFVTFCIQVEYLLLPSNWIIVSLERLHFVCILFRFHLFDVNTHCYDSVIVE